LKFKALGLIAAFALAASFDASALYVQSQQRPDGTIALHLTTEPGPQSAPQLNQDPAIMQSLVNFLGYAHGSYTLDNEMIARQVSDALGSEPSVFDKGVPQGRKLLTAMNDRNQGRERGALLLDDKGRLLAVGLVNGHCTVKSREESLSCNPDPDSVLTLFLPEGANKSDADPIIAWSKEIPELLAMRAESDDPETRASVQKIATVEFVTTHPEQPAWNHAQLPADFPKAMLPLLLEPSSLVGAAADGYFITPGLKGAPIIGDWDEMAGRPVHDFEVLLRTYSSLAQVLKFYGEQAKDAEISADATQALIEGHIGGGTYKIEIKDKEEDGVVITFSAWRKTV